MKSISITRIEDIERLAEGVAKGYAIAKKIPRRGDRVPDELTKKEYVFMTMVMGLEIGMKPMQALQNISLIDGKPVLWGDGMIAVVRDSGELESFNESYSNIDYDSTKMTRKQLSTDVYTDDFCAICKIKRKGYEEKIYKFSVTDAKIANLWCFTTDVKGKQYTPWYKYPKRMLQMRARSWALRDTFADHLAGFSTVEETRDIHQQYDVVADNTPDDVIIEAKETVTKEKPKKKIEKKENKLTDPTGSGREKEERIKEYVSHLAKTLNRKEENIVERANKNFEPFYSSYSDWSVGE